MIPKIIHYIWLGKNPKPAIVNICILSWYEKLPDYQIIEWNESNLDLDKIASENLFFAECRKRNMWAYMADYLRLKILYQYGGIYLDTDMQVLKDFDILLDNLAFAGYEDNQNINVAILGCHPKNPFILEVLKFYDDQIWKEHIYTIPSIFTRVYTNKDYKKLITLYKEEYFYPLPFNTKFDRSYITLNSYSIHWWAESWGGKLKVALFLNTKHIKNPILKSFTKFKKTLGFYLRK